MPKAQRVHTAACMCLLWLSATGVHAQGPPADEVVQFTVTPLGVWRYPEPFVNGINSHGDTVGTFYTPAAGNDLIEPFFQPAGGVRMRLGTLTPDRYTTVRTINDNGWIIGTGDTSVGRHAFVWTPDVGYTDLGTLPGGQSSSASAINNRNEIVGYSDTRNSRRAVLWRPDGVPIDLGGLPGWTGYSSANGINELGHVVGGGAVTQDLSHAFLWTPASGMRDLGELSGGIYEGAAATDVNDADHVAGYSYTKERVLRPFFWSNTTGMINLGALAGREEWAAAYGINGDDWVVGTSGPTPGSHGFLWTPGSGMLDLNDVLAPSAAGWTVIGASSVSDRGEILATAYFGDDAYVVLLTAVPEPAATVAVAAALMTILPQRRRRRRPHLE